MHPSPDLLQGSRGKRALDIKFERPGLIASTFVRLDGETMTIRLKDEVEISESPDASVVVVVSSIDQLVVLQLQCSVAPALTQPDRNGEERSCVQRRHEGDHQGKRHALQEKRDELV